MARSRFIFCSAALAFHASSAFAAPPTGYDWVETFREDCKGASLNPAIWRLANDTHGGILSVRHPRNVSLRGDGLCRLAYRREAIQGKAWSSGGVISVGFQLAFGYFEVRMKYAPAPGGHQSFWLLKQGGTPGSESFEIDINEGHFPRRVSAHVHQTPPAPGAAGAKAFHAPQDLSADFHTFGLLWLPDEKAGAKLTWYMDGKPFHSAECRACVTPAPILLTGAVVGWANPTPELDGKETQFKDLRVYQLRRLAR